MATTQTPAPVPTITSNGNRPVTPHKLFVNIPVDDLQSSIHFFEALGFTSNQHFTDATATCMLVGEDAFFMLLTKERFASFTKRTVGNPRTETSALFAISVESREKVDEMVKAAVAAGGSYAVDSQDHGFMYGWSFYDINGHHWEVFWMDPSAIPA